MASFPVRITVGQNHIASLCDVGAIGEFVIGIDITYGNFRDGFFDTIDVRDELAATMSGFVMALGPFRRIIRDYNQVCMSYYDAIRTRSPSQIQAIDMGRRALHNEGADVLQERLINYVKIDVQTARRLFTLVYVMTLKG